MVPKQAKPTQKDVTFYLKQLKFAFVEVSKNLPKWKEPHRMIEKTEKWIIAG